MSARGVTLDQGWLRPVAAAAGQVSGTANGAATAGRVGAVAGVLALASLPAALFPGVIAQAAGLNALADGPHPYLVPAHALLLYGAVPVVVVSACVLLLAPGLLLALALGAAARLERWLLAGLALSLVMVSAAAAAAQGVLGRPLVGDGFVGVVAASGAAAAALAWVAARRRALALPFPRDRSGLFPLLVVPALLTAALAPKLLWEVLNPDGADAYETARLLLHQPLPFWSPVAKTLVSFPGLTSMTFAFPASWFLRLFGEVEVSARLPFLLALAGAWAGVIELARAGRRWQPSAGARWLVWIGLVPFTLAMTYSASYNPYSADLAMPGAQDTLLIALFLGAAAAFVEDRRGWLAFFVGLTLMSLPNGLMLLVFFLAAALLAQRPRPTGRVLAAAGILVAWNVALALLPDVLRRLGLPQPGHEYGLIAVMRYFAWLQLGEWQRLLWVVVGAGIAPALALLAWRWQDGVGRSLTLVVLAYFLFFYVQGLTVLHHFSPALLLPLVVLWRLAPPAAATEDTEVGSTEATEAAASAARASRAGGAAAAGAPPVGRARPRLSRPAFAGVTLAGALAATLLSLPRVAAPYTTPRAVGATIVDRFGGYESGDPRVFRRALLLAKLFPLDWDPRVPGAALGGAEVIWPYYAAHAPAGRVINYALEPASAPPPAGWRRAAVKENAALDVRSDSVLAAHQALRPAADRGSAVYRIPRGLVFSSFAETGGVQRVRAPDLINRLGLNPWPLLRRLGIRRRH